MIDIDIAEKTPRSSNRSVTDPSIGSQAHFIEALLSGGDSRLAIGGADGTNKYLCKPTPCPDLICASSCTASPVTEAGFQRAAELYRRLTAGASAQQRAVAQAQCAHDIATRLLTYFGATGLADAILCPSGTDALQTASLLVAQERPGESITAILPQASETGTGVPRAATLRPFDGSAPSDIPLIDCVVNAIAIPLRTTEGLPRSPDEIVRAFANAAASVRGRRIVYLTYGTKTGLVAPIIPPKNTEIIVDACQARIESHTVLSFLRNGWPVVVTGSKFFGGPAFSGAVLFPTARLSGRPAAVRPLTTVNIGTLLRWIAAIDAIDAFAPREAAIRDRVHDLAAAIEQGLGRIPTLVPMPGLPYDGTGWSKIPTILNYAVRDPADRQRLLSSTELRPIYNRLAHNQVLLGQPVELGRFGGLRIAIGARDLLPGASMEASLPRLFAVLKAATAPKH